MDREFFDNAASKAKDMLDVAKRKTDGVITLEKLRYIVSSLKVKVSKDYKKLGKIYYESLKDNENLPDDIAAAVEDINEKKMLIKKTEAQIAEIKNKRICPSCGASVEKEAAFCSVCGEKLVFEE